VDLFTYGTLMPGRLRWPLVEADVTTSAHAVVPGRLLDTGRGWPAALFHGVGPDERVHGVVLTIEPARVEAVLEMLDDVEQGYRRVVVTTAAGTVVVSYEWEGPVTEMTVIADGRWPATDER
jgi:gamma-glutamylcyclotransferase (GGCT)/AIG2-like uncharacterized protein YtfP